MSEDLQTPIRRPYFVPHYHGDAVRMLFVVAAGLIFLAELLDARMPYSVGFMVFMVVVLVVAAGITNPTQLWIQWTNVAISLIGLMLFGSTALSRFKEDALFRESFLAACLATIFLVALYLAVRTVRGLIVSNRSPHGQLPPE